MIPPLNPDTDLQLTRRFAAAPARVWRCLTEPELLARWFAPAPWSISQMHLDATPGGAFQMTMRGPDGTEMPMPPGCVLLVEAGARLVWTSALTTGFIPAPPPDAGAFHFTADTRMTKDAEGTIYTVTLRHARAADAKAHADMGFHDGWGTTADQLGTLAATL